MSEKLTSFISLFSRFGSLVCLLLIFPFPWLIYCRLSLSSFCCCPFVVAFFCSSRVTSTRMLWSIPCLLFCNWRWFFLYTQKKKKNDGTRSSFFSPCLLYSYVFDFGSSFFSISLWISSYSFNFVCVCAVCLRKVYKKLTHAHTGSRSLLPFPFALLFAHILHVILCQLRYTLQVIPCRYSLQNQVEAEKIHFGTEWDFPLRSIRELTSIARATSYVVNPVDQKYRPGSVMKSLWLISWLRDRHLDI